MQADFTTECNTEKAPENNEGPVFMRTRGWFHVHNPLEKTYRGEAEVYSLAGYSS